jgi:translation initiation factor IF-1
MTRAARPTTPAEYVRDNTAPRIRVDPLEMAGTVIDTMRDSQVTVRLDDGHELLAYTGGNMRRRRIRMLLDDRVRVEMSPYDRTRGRVSYRYCWPSGPPREAETIGHTVSVSSSKHLSCRRR